MVTADVLGKHTLNVEVRLSREVVEKIDDRKPKRHDEKQREKRLKPSSKEGELSRRKKCETFKLLASPISHAIDVDGADVNF